MYVPPYPPYESVPAAEPPEPGRLCWVSVPFVNSKVQTLERRPKGGQRIVDLEQHHLNEPRLGKGMAYAVTMTKRRPGIILGRSLSVRLRAAYGLGTATRLVLPMYSVEDEEGRDHFPSEFVERVKRFDIPTHFFLPPNPIGLAIPTRDVLLRFDRVQTLPQANIDVEPLAVVQPFLDQIVGWFMFHLTGEHNEVSLDLARLAST